MIDEQYLNREGIKTLSMKKKERKQCSIKI